MSGDDRELVTQQRVLQLFREKLKYKYIGNLREQENSNIIETKLKWFGFHVGLKKTIPTHGC